MNRWYTVIAQPTLLDPVAVITAWGSRENDFQPTSTTSARFAPNVVLTVSGNGRSLIATQPVDGRHSMVQLLAASVAWQSA